MAGIGGERGQRGIAAIPLCGVGVGWSVALAVAAGLWLLTIGQAAGVPQGRANAAKYLHDYIEEQKANGFVARRLAESGNGDATVAPAAK